MSRANTELATVENIVKFPSSRIVNRDSLDSITNIDNAIRAAQEARQFFCEEVLEFAMEQVFATLFQFGFSEKKLDAVSTKDLCMLEEAIRATLYRYHGLDHSLHELTDDNIPDIPTE